MFELCDKYTFLNMDQIPNITPMDLQCILDDKNIYLVEDDNMKIRNSRLILAVLKLTKEDRQNIINSGMFRRIENFHDDIVKQLYACLSFCGLVYLTGEDRHQ